MAEAVKPEYGGIFSAVMQNGGKVLAIGRFFPAVTALEEAVKQKMAVYDQR